MRRLSLFALCALISSFVYAQDIRVDFSDGEFFLAEEDYEEALYAFGKVYNNGYEDNAYINYRMGICLLRIQGRKTEAIPYLEKARTRIDEKVKLGRLGDDAPPDVLLYLGNAYRINQETDKAIAAYNDFAQYIDPNDEILEAFVDQQIISCGNYLLASNNPVDYQIAHMGQLNTTHNNRYNMLVSEDLSTLAFMGKNPFYNGVYVAVKEDSIWGRPMNITPSIASDGNMDVVDLSADGKQMLLAVTDEFTSNIYLSVYENNRWNPARTLGKPINSKYYEAHASFSPDGKSIYFSSNRKGTLGGTDIFRSDLSEDGTWSEPVNLGPAINTTLNEDTPYLSPDGKRLYFSSQGHSSIGGFDVFYTELQEDGSWNEVPVNLGYPLNSTDDDLALSPESIEREGASLVYAQGKIAGYDLFQFHMIGRDATPLAMNIEGKTLLDLQAEEQARREAEAAAARAAAEAEAAAQAAATPKAYYLRPIYFAFESYELTPESLEKLDQLSVILKEHPHVKIEIVGHTDAKGSFNYNQRLSENRAHSVYKYLILNGISKDRMSYIGKSESEFVARNTTRDNRDAPEGRMLNRRVEFTVSLSGDLIIEMEKIQVPEHLRLDR